MYDIKYRICHKLIVEIKWVLKNVIKQAFGKLNSIFQEEFNKILFWTVNECQIFFLSHYWIQRIELKNKGPKHTHLAMFWNFCIWWRHDVNIRTVQCMTSWRHNCIGEDSLQLSGYGIVFSSRRPWFKSCPDLIFLSYIYLFVSLLRTLFLRNLISHMCETRKFVTAILYGKQIHPYLSNGIIRGTGCL